MKSQTRLYIYLPLLIAVIFLMGIYLGSRYFTVNAEKKKVFSMTFPRFDKINDVVRFIQQDYVDSVFIDKVREDAIKGMLRELDPHSQYFSAEELKEANESLVGNFEGIGIEFRMIKDTIMVLHVISGGPSEKMGLRFGDRVVKINGQNVAGIKMESKDAVKMLKGERGSQVTISILRPGVNNLIDLLITRDVIPLYSIDVSYMVDDSLGYIKLSKFSATTIEEFDQAVDRLMQQGMSRLILDLRGNVGGYLQSAIKLADEFLPDRELIVYTIGYNRPKQVAYATKKGKFENGVIVILIDEGSASASEILAGAIQDNDRGLIVGRRSFGKGLVQEQLEMYDGSAIRLTVARYYTPTGRCIQKPYDKGIEEYQNEFYERFRNGEMENPDTIHFPDSLKYITPDGHIVFGGGGIMPNIYIPLKSGEEFVYYNKLINQGVIYQFAFDYADKHKEDLENQFTSAENYVLYFKVKSSLFDEMIKYAEENGIKKDETSLEKTHDNIGTLLKAYIGRNLYNDDAFYPVYNMIDPVFLKAKELLSKTNS